MNVELNKDLLVDLGGWAILKEAKGLQEGGCVKMTEWDEKLLSGEVKVGDKIYHPRLNLRSTIFAENKCNCFHGKSGQMCAHAIALCLEEMVPKPEPEPEVVEEESEPEPLLRSLVLSDEKGVPLRFKVFLPPNLERTAVNDRIMVKVMVEEVNGTNYPPEKIDRGRAYKLTLPHLGAASLIESWCEGKLFGLLQLNRAKLRKLLNALKGEPVVFWINKPDDPIAWSSDILLGVHGLIEQEESPMADSTPKPQPKARESRQTELSNRSDHTGTSPTIVDGSPNFLAIQLPSRSAIDYESLLGLLKDNAFKLETSNRKWWLRDRHRALNFLAEHYETLQKNHRATFTPNFEKQFKHLALAEVKTDIRQVGDEFEVSLTLGSKEDTPIIQSELTRGKMYWESGDKLFIVPQKTVAAFTQLQQKLDNNPTRHLTANSHLRLRSWELADAEGLIEEVVHNFETPDTWKNRSQALNNLSALKEAPTGKTLAETLRLYQKIGTAWLFHLFENKLAGILADEMGLGKTLQALGLVEALLTQSPGLVLVVCPAGLMTNWQREAFKFAPGLKTFIHHGASRAKSVEEWQGYDIVFTSYTTLTRDIKWIAPLEFLAVIADEAQHIKNRRTKNARSLRSLKAKGRFLLTGTPIENSIQDLQSLFDFLLPGYLAKTPTGINQDERAWYHQRIRQKAAPYILRRTKLQVAPELPEKIEQVIYCDPTPEQRSLYDSVRRKSEEAIFDLEMSGAREGRLKMAAFTQLLRLRQVCADPRILKENFEAEHSAKWIAFREILDEATDGGHRILVFSQFVSVLSLLKTELTQQEIPFCYIDGSTKDRLGEADRFNNNEDIPVFLISLKAGGTGLNLTGADTVVHFDPWWNPAVEAQATDRAHRIGQTKVVTSIKLIISGSVEEKVLELQRSKADLLKGLFEESEATSGSLSLEELKDLMK
ncbi:MAG: DEAD/DEAH box helicase [Verrucomicrobia bacterium]|nr:DEAD/DEAH box helicase [Verrucomicrobiota bacterium]MDA1069698.1 DEAD/DEAH box helicase [Verrucomicrobiota bacterium]